MIIDYIKNYFNKLIRNIRAKALKKVKAEKINSVNKIKTDDGYFKTARSWADDIYTSMIVSRNRYKMAFYIMGVFAVLLLLCVLVLVPVQHTELVVVHEGASGYTWLSTTSLHYHPSMNWIREQSEIANYIIARESYDPLLYKYQIEKVKLLSTQEIQAEYELSQSSSNKLAPINIIGAKGYRTVIVNSIFRLDSENKNREGQSKKDRHIDLAQVNFIVVDHLFGQNKKITTPYSGLVSWRYDGVPSSPDDMMKNWDGFKITKYSVEPKNLGGGY